MYTIATMILLIFVSCSSDNDRIKNGHVDAQGDKLLLVCIDNKLYLHEYNKVFLDFDEYDGYIELLTEEDGIFPSIDKQTNYEKFLEEPYVIGDDCVYVHCYKSWFRCDRVDQLFYDDREMN